MDYKSRPGAAKLRVLVPFSVRVPASLSEWRPAFCAINNRCPSAARPRPRPGRDRSRGVYSPGAFPDESVSVNEIVSCIILVLFSAAAAATGAAYQAGQAGYAVAAPTTAAAAATYGTQRPAGYETAYQAATNPGTYAAVGTGTTPAYEYGYGENGEGFWVWFCLSCAPVLQDKLPQVTQQGTTRPLPLPSPPLMRPPTRRGPQLSRKDRPR